MIPTPLERFNKFIEIIPESGCWIWMGGTTKGGYGVFSLEGKATGAHRAAWIIFNGSIPDGMNICHKCDIRECVNPKHLFIGTQADNVLDMVKKNRAYSKGKQFSRSKLDVKDILYIRTSTIQTKYLCKIFSVRGYVIRKARNKTYWKNITQEEQA